MFFSTIMVWLLVKEPNKGTTAEKTSMFQDIAEGRVPGAAVADVRDAGGGHYGNAIVPVLALHLEKLLPDISDRARALVFALPAVAFVLTSQLWTRIGERRGFPGAAVRRTGGRWGLRARPGSWRPASGSFASVYFVSGDTDGLDLAGRRGSDLPASGGDFPRDALTRCSRPQAGLGPL